MSDGFFGKLASNLGLASVPEGKWSRSGNIRLAGILCLVLSAVVIGMHLLESHRFEDLQGIVDSGGKYLGSITLFILHELILIAVGALFYLIFRRHNPSLALFGLIGILGTGFLWLVWDFPVYSFYYLAQEYSAATGAAADSIAQRAADMSSAFDFPYIIDYSLLSLGFIALGALILRTRAIHPLLGSLAIILGILHLFMWIGALTLIASGNNVTDDWGAFWDAVSYARDTWFALVGLWLLAKGVREAPANSSESQAAV